MRQVKFKLYSGLTKAKMMVEKGGDYQEIQIDRPFYRDELEVDWISKHYKIIRTGVLIRDCKIYKAGEYIGRIQEKIGLMTHFNVYLKAKTIVEIKEREQITKQTYDIMRGSNKIGEIRPVGVYVPVLSNLGKGFEGEFEGLNPEEEEALLLAIIAVGS